MRLIFLSAFFLTSLSAQADIVDYLKSQPASLYDVGRLRMENYALLASSANVGRNKWISGYLAEIGPMTVVEEDEGLFYIASFGVRTNMLVEETCPAALETAIEINPNIPSVETIFPGLSSGEYEEIATNHGLKVEIFAAENTQLRLLCEVTEAVSPS